ncbi:MAG: hypothetical protein ABIF77_08190 [bacterium]
MSVVHCTWCGAEITEEGVGYKGRLFCSDECCEQYQDDLEKNGEPNPEELEQDFIADDLEIYDFSDDGEMITDDEDDLDLADDF